MVSYRTGPVRFAAVEAAPAPDQEGVVEPMLVDDDNPPEVTAELARRAETDPRLTLEGVRVPPMAARPVPGVRTGRRLPLRARTACSDPRLLLQWPPPCSAARTVSSHPLLNIAIRAARKAGNVIARNIDRIDALVVSEKAPNDFVTEVDRTAERRIIDTVRTSYPDHAFLAEESGSHGHGDFEWIIDPLDGTANFVHGFPHVAVSIAVRHRGRTEHAVVFDPLRQELFTASRGAGGRLEDRRLRVARKAGLKGTMLGSGLPLREFERIDLYHAALKGLMSEAAQVRRSGSAALDLAYVAAGRLDGFWQSGLSPWDVAAGALLVQEAGGIVAEPDGGDDYLRSGNVVAANPKVLRAMLPHLQHGPKTRVGTRRSQPRATRPETAPPEATPVDELRPPEPRRTVPDRPSPPAGTRTPGPDATLPIILVPSPAEVFRRALMRTKQAWILVTYRDGREEVRRWKAPRITATSNIVGNLRSRPEFRPGTWQQNGVACVQVSIERPKR